MWHYLAWDYRLGNYLACNPTGISGCDRDYLACDPSKICRARQIAMNKAQQSGNGIVQQEGRIQAIYSNRRNDNARAMEPDSMGKLHPRIITEEQEHDIEATPEPATSTDKPVKLVADGL